MRKGKDNGKGKSKSKRKGKVTIRSPVETPPDVTSSDSDSSVEAKKAGVKRLQKATHHYLDDQAGVVDMVDIDEVEDEVDEVDEGAEEAKQEEDREMVDLSRQREFPATHSEPLPDDELPVGELMYDAAGVINSNLSYAQESTTSRKKVIQNAEFDVQTYERGPWESDEYLHF